jgi:MarR family transcriptional regulator, lower aerobic nicotinate degradation pathway regulator
VTADYPPDLAGRTGFLLARAHVLARQNADRALSKLGLTAKSYAALATVMNDGPTSQQKLSHRLRMDPATMVDVIDSLERSGHILRKRNPDDRREYALIPTSKGRALSTRARRALDGAERETLGDLDPDDVRTLRELLRRVAQTPGELTTADGERELLGR